MKKWLGNLRRYIGYDANPDMIREKKLKVTNEITNVIIYYNSSFHKQSPTLWSNTDAWRKSRGIKLDNLSLLPWECGLAETEMAILLPITGNGETISHSQSEVVTIALTRFIHSIAPSHSRPTYQKPG